jgi:integrase/recombinase XerD
MWLHGRPEGTRDIYLPVIQDFRKHVGDKPVSAVTLSDLQGYADLYATQKQSTIDRKLSTVRSLLTFAHRTGMIPFDVGRALRLPKVPETLIEKLLSEDEIQRIIAAETDRRNQVLLRILYASGIRASEAAGLRWGWVKPRQNGGGQITVLGKGVKVRSILLPQSAWRALESIKPNKAKPEDPVFVNKNGKALDRTRITHIVGKAAAKAGIDKAVSAHWMRHGHASHAIDRGAPITLVQTTLGHGSIITTSRYIHAQPDQSSSQFLR